MKVLDYEFKGMRVVVLYKSEVSVFTRQFVSKERKLYDLEELILIQLLCFHHLAYYSASSKKTTTLLFIFVCLNAVLVDSTKLIDLHLLLLKY